MKHTIDITGGKVKGLPREVLFAKPGMFKGFNSWDGAQRIVEMSDNHEGHFGCMIMGGAGSKMHVDICSVEHAEALIQGLRYAIDNGFLFTDKQLKKHHTSATDTRGRIKEKIRKGGDE